MLIWDAIDPVELTGYVRAALADREQNQLTLSRWLPNRTVNDLEFRFNAGGQGLIDAGVFRSYDAEARIAKRPSTIRVSGELPPLSEKIRLGEYDRLRQRNATQEINDTVFNDAVRMMLALRARLELARGEALYRGRIDLSENGVIATIDFGRNAGHTVAPGILWSTVATAVPLTDELGWIDTYVANTGVRPGAAICSTTVLGYLLRNAEYRALVGRNGFVPSRVSRADVDAIRQDYELPPLEIYDTQVSVGGVATRVIPADRFVFVPPADANPETNELGGTLYGVTAEALEIDGLEGTDEAGITAVAMKTFDPVSIWTKAAAVAIPVLANPDLTFTADVA